MQTNVPKPFFPMEEPPVRIVLNLEETLPMKRSTAGNLFVVLSEAEL